MNYILQFLIVIFFGASAFAADSSVHPMTRGRPQVVTKPAPALTPTATTALETFNNLKAYQESEPDICRGGARSWTKVFAAQMAYREVGRAVYEVGDTCADVGSEDVLGLQEVIPVRVRRIKDSDAYKMKCWEAWHSRIIVEKEFINGPEKIIETFQSNCYSSESADSGNAATR